jgi:hypothetical protein
MQSSSKPPTREELLQKLKAAKTRSYLGRLPKKQRESKIEEMKSQLSTEQQTMMAELQKHFTPEQLQQFSRQFQQNASGAGANEDINTPIVNEGNTNNTEEEDIPEINADALPISLPRMKPIPVKTTENIVENKTE